MRRRVRGRPAPLGPNENRDLPRHPIRVGPGNQTDARHAAVNRQIVSAPGCRSLDPLFFCFLPVAENSPKPARVPSPFRATDRRYHTYCLAPPLDTIPEGDWFCPDCIASANHAEDLGFNTGKTFTVDEFEAHCDAFDARFFGADEKETLKSARPPIPVIEEHFWRMVEEGGGDAVDVHYGADVDTSVHGSAFPRAWDSVEADDAAKRAAATHPWNLNNVPRHPRPGTGPGGLLTAADDARTDDSGDDGEHRSLLRRVHDHIPGVLVPWLYFGSTFSSFCWHFEDHALYSMNYNHLGAAKTWYGVPGSHADDFEKSFKKAMPDLFASQPDLLFQLVTMLSPSLLRDDGVPVFRTDQHAGEFVVTFPRSYHAGFNTGFNVAEAVNFAPPDWLRFGRDGAERYRDYRKPSVLCHDELLCVAAADAPTGPETAKWLLGDLRRTVAEERAAREALVAAGVVRSRRYTPKKLAAKAAAAAGALELRREAMAGGRGGKKSSEKSKDRGPEDPHDAAERVLPNENANGAYDRECTICRYILHLSGVACSCAPDRPACLRHSAELCDCDNSKRVLFYRKSIAQLEQLVKGVERLCGGKKAKTSQPADAAAKARQKKAAAWAKEAKAVLAQKAPPPAPEALERMLVASEEFTWAGEDMDDVRKVAHQVSIAIAFQRELAVLKRRIDAAEQLAGDAAAEPITWSEPEVDDADIVVAAAAGAPVRVRRGGKYVDRETEQEAAARRAAESEAAAAAEAKVDRAVALEETKQTERSSEKKPLEETKATDALPSKETPDPETRRASLGGASPPHDAAPPPRASGRRAFPHPRRGRRGVRGGAGRRRGPGVTRGVRARRTPAPQPQEVHQPRRGDDAGAAGGGRRRRGGCAKPSPPARPGASACAGRSPARGTAPATALGCRARRSSWRCARTPPSSPYSPTTFRRWTPRSRRRRRGAKPRGRYWTPTSASAPTRASRSERAEKLLAEGEAPPRGVRRGGRRRRQRAAAARAWDEEAEKADEADAKLDVLKRLLSARAADGETGTPARRPERPAAGPPGGGGRAGGAHPRPRVGGPGETRRRRQAHRRDARGDARAASPPAPPGGGDRRGRGRGAAAEKEKEKEKKRGSRKKGGASRSPPPPAPGGCARRPREGFPERQLLEPFARERRRGEAEAKASSVLASAAAGALPPLEDVERLVKEEAGIPATLEGSTGWPRRPPRRAAGWRRRRPASRASSSRAAAPTRRCPRWRTPSAWCGTPASSRWR